MNTNLLSFRQRQLLHILSRKNDYITGKELADALHVTARTIRSDVQEINSTLASSEVKIVSRHHFGYKLEAADMTVLNDIRRTSSSFLSRTDRIRYMVFKLVLSDEPLNLWHLEDEMFISNATLEQDLQVLRKKYILPAPHIGFYRRKNTIELEHDERKRRNLLCLLFSESWDYHGRGSLYYKYPFIEESVMNLIIQKCVIYLSEHKVRIDDINLILLELTIAVSYYRMRSGHILTLTKDVHQMFLSTLNPASITVSDCLLDDLETELDTVFPEAERMEIYHRLSISRLISPDILTYQNIMQYFPKNIFSFANAYLQHILLLYGIDLTKEESFYGVLVQYLYYLSRPEHALNQIPDQTSITSDYLIEFEIAYAIQPQALSFYGDYLSFDELLYLSHIIHGAFSSMNRNAPKLKTLLISHINLPGTWNLKQSILNRFGSYISIEEMLPMYEKDDVLSIHYDMVISTTNKAFPLLEDQQLITIHPLFQKKDELSIETAIHHIHINRLYKATLPSLPQLLKTAAWHTNMKETDYLSLLETLANDFITQNIVSHEYLQDLLRRESMFTFAVRPGVIIAHSLAPAKETRLSIGMLEHRIRRNDYKIRVIIMAALTQEDYSLIFKLINEIYYGKPAGKDPRFLMTQADLISYLLE